MSQLLRDGEFQSVIDYPLARLEPMLNTYDSIKLILLLIAAANLKLNDLTITLFDRILFRDGLYLLW